VPPGITEQSVVAAAMVEGGPLWIESIRGAASMVMTRVAWDDIRETRHELNAARGHVAHLEQQVVILTARAAQLAKECERLRADAARAGSERDDGAAETRAAREARDRMQSALTDLAASELAVRHELAATLRSVSWRVTRPLRAIKRWPRTFQT